MFEKLRQTFTEFVDDDCPMLAAALAYYTVFSLPPLLYIIIVVAGFIVGREAVQAAIQHQVQATLGGSVSGQLATMASGGAGQTSGSGTVGIFISIAGVIFGATAAFAQLQTALNRAWNVEPKSSGIREFLLKRILSFGIILLIASLILASVVLNAWSASVVTLFGAPAWIIEAASLVVSAALLFALFSILFRYLPDTDVQWSDVLVGALVTAILFEIGRFLLALYLGTTATASMYGAAGSLALILLFVYYSSMLILLGAEFTQVWAKTSGPSLSPSRGHLRSRRFRSA